MAFPFIGEKQYNYLHSQLQKIQNQQAEELEENEKQTENRACSSLCQLSENICIDQGRNTKYMGIGLSPWKLKNQQNRPINQPEKDSFYCKSSALSMVERGEIQRCRTENKENIYQYKANNQYSHKLTKLNSIFFKKVEPKERKVLTSKSESQQIELLALMCKKNKYSMQINETTIFKERHKGNITQPLINKSFTPKILNLCHLDQQNQRESEKRLSKNMVGGQYEDIKDQIKNITLVNEHWKAKSFQSKSKKNKKTVVLRDSKSSEAREVRENLLFNKRGPLSVGKERKGEYRSNNPLTRLLYEKYLNTIGVNHPKDFRNKYL